MTEVPRGLMVPKVPHDEAWEVLEQKGKFMKLRRKGSMFRWALNRYKCALEYSMFAVFISCGT